MLLNSRIINNIRLMPLTLQNSIFCHLLPHVSSRSQESHVGILEV